MADRVNDLIERLVADVSPVRRLRSPFVRAVLWFLPIVTVMAIAVSLLADLNIFAARAGDERLFVELTATILTAIAAILAACELSLPDRSGRWLFLPLAPLSVWLATTGYGCYRHFLSYGPGGWQLGESANCFLFILAVSFPLGISLFILLRRAAPIAPIPVAVAGGLAVAALSAFALQFFHPFDTTFLDLGVHAAAIGIVVLVMTASGNLLAAAHRPSL